MTTTLARIGLHAAAKNRRSRVEVGAEERSGAVEEDLQEEDPCQLGSHSAECVGIDVTGGVDRVQAEDGGRGDHRDGGEHRERGERDGDDGVGRPLALAPRPRSRGTT